MNVYNNINIRITLHDNNYNNYNNNILRAILISKTLYCPHK